MGWFGLAGGTGRVTVTGGINTVAEYFESKSVIGLVLYLDYVTSTGVLRNNLS